MHLRDDNSCCAMCHLRHRPDKGINVCQNAVFRRNSLKRNDLFWHTLIFRSVPSVPGAKSQCFWKTDSVQENGCCRCWPVWLCSRSRRVAVFVTSRRRVASSHQPAPASSGRAEPAAAVVDGRRISPAGLWRRLWRVRKFYVTCRSPGIDNRAEAIP